MSPPEAKDYGIIDAVYSATGPLSATDGKGGSGVATEISDAKGDGDGDGPAVGH